VAPAATLAVELALVLAVVSAVAWTGRDAAPPDGYVDIADVPTRPTPAVGGGTFSWSCGSNEVGHRNTANVVVAPGWTGPAHHTHDYVGNLDVDPRTDLNRLAESPTTCANGDASTYFWPVLRLRAGTGHHDGVIQAPAAVTLTFAGSAHGDVLPIPTLLRGTVGDALAATNGGANASPTWTCGDRLDRRTTRYPACAAGERVTRVFDFPSCWDGRRVDSADHRSHLVFAALDGTCPRGTFALPRLRMMVAYDLPADARFAIDAFAEQHNDPSTDHAFFVNAMPAALMSDVVSCLNTGRRCESGT
jgi:hypothetical protein